MRLRRIALAVVLVTISVGAVAYTFTAAVAYSAFAAGVLKASICIGLFVAVDELVLGSYDTWDVIKDDPKAVAIALVAVALLLAPAIATGQPTSRDMPAVVDTARTHVGVTEQPPGSNEGDMVETYLSSVDLGGGYPWCAAFTSYVLDRVGAKAPSVRSAVATDFITDRSIDATEVIRGTATVPRGALSIHRRGSTWKGHIGIVTTDDLKKGRPWENRCGHTIEGNTSPGDTGPQRDGEGVWRRHRCIRPGSYFRIVAFTPTR